MVLTIATMSVAAYAQGGSQKEMSVDETVADSLCNAQKYQSNDKFIINLEENPTTGYLWSVAKAINVKLLSEKYNPSQPQMAGSGGTKICTFAVENNDKAGQLTMQYKRPWEKKPIKTKSYTFLSK